MSLLSIKLIATCKNTTAKVDTILALLIQIIFEKTKTQGIGEGPDPLFEKADKPTQSCVNGVGGNTITDYLCNDMLLGEKVRDIDVAS